MNTKTVVIILVIVSALAVAGYFLYQYLNPVANTDATTSASSSSFIGRSSYNAVRKANAPYKKRGAFKVYNN